MKASMNKGVYTLNPTSMIMKQGSEQSRAANARGAGAGNRRPGSSTQQSETKKSRDQAKKILDSHSDGRKNENDHSAVRLSKGMK